MIEDHYHHDVDDCTNPGNDDNIGTSELMSILQISRDDMPSESH